MSLKVLQICLINFFLFYFSCFNAVSLNYSNERHNIKQNCWRANAEPPHETTTHRLWADCTIVEEIKLAIFLLLLFFDSCCLETWYRSINIQALKSKSEMWDLKDWRADQRYLYGEFSSQSFKLSPEWVISSSLSLSLFHPLFFTIHLTRMRCSRVLYVGVKKWTRCKTHSVIDEWQSICISKC